MTWDRCSRGKTVKDNLVQVPREILLCKSKCVACPPPSSSLFCAPTPFCCHSVQPSSSLLQYPNEKKLVGKSWTESYINLQPSHGTAQGEGGSAEEEEKKHTGRERKIKQISRVHLLIAFTIYEYRLWCICPYVHLYSYISNGNTDVPRTKLEI